MNDGEKNTAIKIICFVVAGLCAVAAVACIVAYATTKLDVLFIPISLCIVGVMISLTYGFSRRS